MTIHDLKWCSFSKLKFIVISKMGYSMKLVFLKGITETNVCLDKMELSKIYHLLTVKHACSFDTIYSEDKV